MNDAALMFFGGLGAFLAGFIVFAFLAEFSQYR